MFHPDYDRGPNFSLLIHAYNVVMSKPSHQVYLGDWGKIGDCGTIACAAGWIGTDPVFQALGIHLVFSDKSKLGNLGVMEFNGELCGLYDPYENLARIFNITEQEALSLFLYRTLAEHNQYGNLTDQQLFELRMKNLFEMYDLFLPAPEEI